jgi:hypothetical protein
MRTTGVLLLFACSTVNLPATSQSHYCWTEGMRRFDVTARGPVEFSDDDRDVKRLSPGGYFRVEENYVLLFAGRWYEVSADSLGRLSRTYYDHGQQRPLDSQGQAWLMRAMPEAIRHTGLGAGPRLQRILKQSGPAAALTEISRIDSDESKRIYLQELITKNGLGREPLEGAMLQARKIGSDDEKSELLRSVASYYLKDGLREPIFQVAGTIGSDEDRANVLCDLVDRDLASRESLKLAAKTANHIGSDEEKAKVLVKIAGRYKGDREVGRALLASASTIGSDEERHRVLAAALAASGNDREMLQEALRAGAGIGSDEEKAALLTQAAPHYLEDDFTRRAFFEAAGTIGSDEERRKVLSALLRRSSLTDATLADVARCAKSIGSDEEKAGVLSEMADANLQNPAVRTAFFAAADSIGSDEERKKVLVAVAHHAGNSAEILSEIARSARHIGSDDEKAEVLAEIAASHSANGQLRDEFFAAVDSIGSEDERVKVLSAMLRTRVGKETVIRVIESAEHISSDEIKANILTKVVESPAGDDPQVRAALQKALRSIQSDGEYRRIMSAYTKQ